MNIPKLSVISVTIAASLGFLGASVVKNSLANTGDTRDADSFPRLGKSPVGGNVYLLQYSCLENTKDRGAWWTIVHEVAKSWTCLSMHTYTHITASLCDCLWYFRSWSQGFKKSKAKLFASVLSKFYVSFMV